MISYVKQISVYLVLLALVLFLFECTNLDLLVQDQFYLTDLHRWVVDKKEPVLRFLFYTGPKAVLITTGVSCLFGWFLSYRDNRFKEFRRQFLLMSLSLSLVPLTISGIKNISNVCTPDKIIRYGGKQPYVKVLEKYPDGFQQAKRSKGWPAGHASGGFSLMMLYFIFTQKNSRIFGLCLGLIAGWGMGLYQTLNGEHYLSHTIVSMLMAWILIITIQRVFQNHNLPPKVAWEAGAPLRCVLQFHQPKFTKHNCHPGHQHKTV